MIELISENNKNQKCGDTRNRSLYKIIQETWDEYGQVQQAIELIDGIDMNEQNMYQEEFLKGRFLKQYPQQKNLIETLASEKGNNLHWDRNRYLIFY